MKALSISKWLLIVTALFLITNSTLSEESQMTSFNGEEYRDDRLYVINLKQGRVKSSSGVNRKWIITTYRNTKAIPPVRVDQFDTQDAAIAHLKKVEPEVPLISNGGEPVQMPKEIQNNSDSRWRYWLSWLEERGLMSAISGRQHVPYYVDKRGYTFKIHEQTIIEMTPDGRESHEATESDADTQYELGVSHAKGLGVTQDFKEAARWFRKAAEQGHANAQGNLGAMYANGQGVPQDYKKAARWFRKAAEQGHSNAQGTLGAMYANGQGVPQDYKEAASWYRKAAEQGEPMAQRSLGSMYTQGLGVHQDQAEATYWYQMAAEQEDASAQYNLGMRYSQGKGVPQDQAEAVRWFRAAAKQSHIGAQYNLGSMYYHGRGVDQDYAEAAKWYRRAAEQGHANAQNDLGVLYAEGSGVPQDYPTAYMWANLAAAQDFDYRRFRDALADYITPVQKAEGHRLRREWLKKHGE